MRKLTMLCAALALFMPLHFASALAQIDPQSIEGQQASFYSLNKTGANKFNQSRPLRIDIVGQFDKDHLQNFSLMLFCRLSNAQQGVFTMLAPASSSSDGAYVVVDLTKLSSGTYELLSASSEVSQGSGYAQRLYIGAQKGHPLATFEVTGDMKDLPGKLPDPYPAVVLDRVE